MPAAEVAFRAGHLRIDEAELRYLEAGDGQPLVVLASPVAAPARGFELLASRCRVVLLEVAEADARGPNGGAAGSKRRIAALAHAARQIAGGSFALSSAADQTRLAVHLATEAAADVVGLVLVAPEDVVDAELRSALGALGLPVLVVYGTEDSVTPPERGRDYVAALRMPLSMLVYAAGHTIDRDRPEAFASLIGDFVTRGAREFLAPPESTLINP